jgi:hypothetical protein
MKGLLLAAGVLAILYVWDQQFEQGQYTRAAVLMMRQIQRSFGW